jgi:hypothetical protein
MSQTQIIDYLAEQQIKAIFSRGENTQQILQSLICKQLESSSANFLTQAKSEFDLFARHTHQSRPKIVGLYLKLLHGRVPIDLELDDWGDDGPWVGPLKWFHCTYMATLGIGFEGGTEFFSSSGSISVLPSPMYICEDMIYYDGLYYGDWELQLISG